MKGKVTYRIFDFCDWNTFLAWRLINRHLKKDKWTLVTWREEKHKERHVSASCDKKRWCKYKGSEGCPGVKTRPVVKWNNIVTKFYSSPVLIRKDIVIEYTSKENLHLFE